MKRPCDDSSSGDSEPEESIDVGSESLYPGHLKASFITYGSPSTTTAPQVTARKRRRGIIEKRRRDRINNSLLELRRLVPTAVEKQGSAKLEKAEILQMTVDHLKMLQITGGKGYLDVHALALDFLSVGFRECVSEVSRFLSVVEGLDGGDPLPSRLLSHLASCASQRHAASFAATAAAHSPHHHHHHHHLHQQHHHLHQQQQQPPPIHPHHWAAAAAAVATAAAFRPLPPAGGATPFGRGATSECGAPTPDSSSSSSSSSSLLLPCGPAPLSASLLSLSASLHSFPVALHAGLPLLPAFPSHTAAATSPASSSSSAASQTPPSSSQRAYRPWGAEVGAF